VCYLIAETIITGQLLNDEIGQTTLELTKRYVIFNIDKKSSLKIVAK